MTLQIAPHVKDTTWDGISLSADTYDDNNVKIPVDLTGVEILCEVKKDKITFLTFKTQDNSILVPDPETGVYNIVGLGNRIINIPADTYEFDVRATLTDGTVELLCPTILFPITQNVSD